MKGWKFLIHLYINLYSMKKINASELHWKFLEQRHFTAACSMVMDSDTQLTCQLWTSVHTHYHTQKTKMGHRPKWPATVKLLKKAGENLCDVGWGKNLLEIIPKGWYINEWNDEVNGIKWENSCSLKNTIRIKSHRLGKNICKSCIW